MNKHIFVVGAARSGKSTFAAELAHALDWYALETGDVLVCRVANQAALDASPGDPSAIKYARMIRDDKEKYRPALIARATAETALVPDALIEDCIRHGARVIVGVRRECEFRAYAARHPGELERVILVSRPHLESQADGWEARYFMSLARTVVVNGGTVEELQAQSNSLAAELQA